jgi:hypothetical protein
MGHANVDTTLATGRSILPRSLGRNSQLAADRGVTVILGDTDRVPCHPRCGPAGPQAHGYVSMSTHTLLLEKRFLEKH